MYAALGMVGLSAATRVAPLQSLVTQLVTSEHRGAFVALRNTLSQCGNATAAFLASVLYPYGFQYICWLTAGFSAMAVVLILFIEEPEPENQIESGESAIQTTISVRVISALTSTVIAAKSDFATARNEDLLAGELDAFGDASRKLSGFLLKSLNRYWKAPSASQGIPESQLRAPSTVAPPSSMEDL